MVEAHSERGGGAAIAFDRRSTPVFYEKFEDVRLLRKFAKLLECL